MPLISAHGEFIHQEWLVCASVASSPVACSFLASAVCPSCVGGGAVPCCPLLGKWADGDAGVWNVGSL